MKTIEHEKPNDYESRHPFKPLIGLCPGHLVSSLSDIHRACGGEKHKEDKNDGTPPGNEETEMIAEHHNAPQHNLHANQAGNVGDCKSSANSSLPWRRLGRFFATTVLASFVLNEIWEMAQMSAYVETAKHSWASTLSLCTRAAVGDVGIILGIYAACALNDAAAPAYVLVCPVVSRSQRKEWGFMMNQTAGWMGGWAGGGMWVWMVIGLLVVLLVVQILKLSKKQ